MTLKGDECKELGFKKYFLFFTLCEMASNADIITLCFYTYITLKMLYACDSVMMSVYDITENIL